MLLIDRPARTIPKREYFDNRSQEFITVPEVHYDEIHLKLEHSLMSIAKWEGRWHEPFIGCEDLTGEKFIDYIRCMTVNQVKNPKVYDGLTEDDLMTILTYMGDEHSAWKIQKPKKPIKGKKKQTVEEFYYAMIQFGVPPEYEQWHFNRLVALLDFCNSKGGSVSGAGGPKKKSEREIMEMYRALNEKNRKKFHSKG